MEARSSFASYARDKQAVAETLRAAQVYFEQQGRQVASEALRSLLSHLAEDRFNLVVVGQFKRGKSSLINALLGRDVLPTAIVPLTSIITVIRYGPAERALVFREGGGPALTVALSELADYVTERGNPNNEKKVKSVEVEVPSAFLRRGLHVVDTPGIASAYTSNTASTYAFLPEADAVIFVTSVESPLTEAELAFVDTIRQSVERVFFVLNKVDHASPTEQREAIAFAEHLLRQRLGTPSLRLFPLSARQALEGKMSGEHRRIEQSGLSAFEEALASFLRAEREATFLRATLDRAHRLLVEEQHLLGLLQNKLDRNGYEPRDTTLTRFLDDLTGERDGVLNELAARRSAFLAEFVASELSAFADAARAPLRTEMEARIAEAADGDADTCYQTVRRWLREALDARRRTWLTDHSGDWEAVARDFLRTARQELNGADDNPLAPTEPGTGRNWGLSEQPLPFEARADRSARPTYQPGDGSPLFGLPRPLASRALRRRLHEDLDREITQTAEVMSAEVDRYLSAVIDQIRRETDRALDDIRKAVETPTPGSHGRADGSNDAEGEPEDRAQQVEALISRLNALRDGRDKAILTDEPIIVNEAAIIPTESTEATPNDGVDRVTLTNALGRGACPVCSLVQDAVWEFLRRWQYTLATDETARQVFRADGGFCNEHTWALEAVASPRGLCAGYLPLLDRLAQEVGALPGLPSSTIRDRLTTSLPNTARCRLCVFKRQREGAALRCLAAALDTAEGRADYLRTDGLCLPHARALLDVGVNEETASFLVEETARHLSTAADDMRGYALKVDARRRDLITPPEERSYLRVPALLVGGRQSLRSPG